MDQPTFLKAAPIWAGQLQGVMNAGFRATARFSWSPGLRLQLAGHSNYRVWLNGHFLHAGPARGPHGYARVDSLSLPEELLAGSNELVIEVVAYHVWTYSHAMDAGFLQAEVLSGATPVCWTAVDGAFQLSTWPTRLQKTRRYSFQRAFAEAYDLTTGGQPELLKVIPRIPRRLLPRRAPYPTYEISSAATLLSVGTAKRLSRPRKDEPNYGEEKSANEFKQFPRNELQSNVLGDLAWWRYEVGESLRQAWVVIELEPSRFAVLDLSANLTGFLRLRVRTKTGCHLAAMFDELLIEDGTVDPRRISIVNAVPFNLPPGEHTLETFEPYTLRYLQLHTLSGECEVLEASIRRFENPNPATAKFECSDEGLNLIFEAGRTTLAQNSVDLYMDCPSRERAGWLGDSYFTARAEYSLTGASVVEHAFLENFLLSPSDAKLPEGVLPMCYPADHPDGQFIPQWTLWLVLELEEYARRGGDPELIGAFRSRVEKLLSWFERLERDDHVLTGLPSWSFIEWSKANEFQRDLNYPSSMLYAGALEAAGRLYDRPDWATKADSIREVLQQEAWNGTFFVDNATLTGGHYSPTQNRTEVCQYYAFYFGVATPASHPELWKTLVTEFGPDRIARGLHHSVYPANMIWGIMLRLELLRAAGLAEEVLRDVKGYLLPMAMQTRTLWEHDRPMASCNHGFASHACHLLIQEAAGVVIKGTKVLLKSPPPSLSWCKVELPTPDGWIKISWRRDSDNQVISEHTVPNGYDVVTSGR